MLFVLISHSSDNPNHPPAFSPIGPHLSDLFVFERHLHPVTIHSVHYHLNLLSASRLLPHQSFKSRICVCLLHLHLHTYFTLIRYSRFDPPPAAVISLRNGIVDGGHHLTHLITSALFVAPCPLSKYPLPTWTKNGATLRMPWCTKSKWLVTNSSSPPQLNCVFDSEAIN